MNCSCGKSFTVKAKDLPSRNRLTVPLRMSIINDLAEYMTIKTIASKNNVSEYFVRETLKSISYPLDEIGEVICIDEFKGNLSGNKYQAIMVNPVTKRITNIYPTRYKKDLAEEFAKIDKQKRFKVKFFICDM